MKVKLFHAYSTETLEKQVQTFLDEIDTREEEFHIMNFNFTSNEAGWAASLLYMQIETNKGENDGRHNEAKNHS